MMTSASRSLSSARPNVGKSSLVNHILGEEPRDRRQRWPAPPATPSTAIVENKYGKLRLHRYRRPAPKAARWRTALSATASCAAWRPWSAADVCVIMIDATEGFTEQDSKVAGYAHEQGKACIIAVNKWDAVEKDD